MTSNEPRTVGQVLSAAATVAAPDAGELAHVAFSGRWYQVHKTHCAGCNRVVLIASRGRHSAIYDRIVLDPLHGPHGERHNCPAGKGVSNG